MRLFLGMCVGLLTLEVVGIRISFDEAFTADLSRVTALYTKPGDLADPGRRGQIVSMRMWFPNLHTLELRNQGIDDDFLANLCEDAFPRLINLDVRDNPLITRASLDMLLGEPVLGSVRSLPQFSGRYGNPASEIYVKAEGTGITDADRTDFNKEPRFDFTIKYLHPMTGQKTAPTADCAIKWIRVDTV